MSSGFSGSSTRSMGKLEREIESRMKRMDVFTDDFQPPGSFEKVPGTSVDKPANGYQAKHTDTVSEADPSFVHMAPAGNPKDQKPMDDLDIENQRREGGIKPEADQFPGMKKELLKMFRGQR